MAPGRLARHVAEVFGCHHRLGLDQRVRADDIARRDAYQPRHVDVVDHGGVAGPQLEFEVAAQHAADLQHLGQFVAQLLAHAVVEAAHGAGEIDLAGNDVRRCTGQDHADGERSRLGRVDASRANAVDGVQHLRQDEGRIDGLVRERRRDRPCRAARPRTNLRWRWPEPSTMVMRLLAMSLATCSAMTPSTPSSALSSIMRVAPDLFSSSASSSLGWKRKRTWPAGRSGIARQDGGDAQQDGRVRVVAARVHDARRLRGVGNVILLLDGEGVHVGADGDDRAAVAQVADDAGLADAALRFDPKRGELRRPRDWPCVASWKLSSGCMWMSRRQAVSWSASAWACMRMSDGVVIGSSVG